MPHQEQTQLGTGPMMPKPPFAKVLPDTSIESSLPALLRLKDILKLVPIGRSTVWAWVKQDRFPQPVRPFGNSCTVWRREDIIGWLEKAGS